MPGTLKDGHFLDYFILLILLCSAKVFQKVSTKKSKIKETKNGPKYRDGYKISILKSQSAKK